MAEKPTTLLERLNQVLESLALKIGAGGASGASSGSAPSNSPGNNQSFLEWMKSLVGAGKPNTTTLTNSNNQQSRESTAALELKVAMNTLSDRLSQLGKNVSTAERALEKATKGGLPTTKLEKQRDKAELEWQQGKEAHTEAKRRYAGEKAKRGFGEVANALGGSESNTGRSVGSKVSEAADTAQLAGRAAAGDPTAMLGLADKVAKQVENQIAAFGKANDSLAQSATSDSAGRQVGGVFGAGEAAGDMMGGATGEAVSKVAAFGKKVSESVDRLRDMDRAVLQMNFRFGEVSSSMAMVQARQEVRDIMQDRQKGEARAGSQERLAEAMSELNQSLMPFENAFMNFSTNVLTGVTRIVNWLVQNEPLLKLMTTYLEKIAGKGDEAVGGSSFNADIFEAGAEEAKKFGRPPRIPPGP